MRAYAVRLPTALILLGLLDLASALQGVLAARLVALVLALLLPGSCLLGAVRIRFGTPLLQWAAALGGSAAVLMAWGALGGPVSSLGLARPLDRLPVLVMLDVLVVAAALVAAIDRDPILEVLPLPGRVDLLEVATGGLCLLTLLAALIGVERLNGTGSAAGVQAAFGLIALTLAAGAWRSWRGDGALGPLCMAAAGLALLWVTSYRGSRLFGYDIQQEYQRFGYVFDQARWVPPTNGDPYASMLSITALPAGLSHLTGISGLYLFKGLFPVCLALVPALAVEVAARWAPRWAAYFGGVYLIVLPQFSGQLPGIARQEVGFFYFALLLALLFAPAWTGARRLGCLLACTAALVVSHYSTSYVATLLLAVGWVSFAIVRMVRRLRCSGRRFRRGDRPMVPLVVVLAAMAMVVGWDSGLTNSSGNVTNFVSSVVEQGPDFLPNVDGGGILSRWLNGNVTPNQTPAAYYKEAAKAAETLTPWLHPYPKAITDEFPAQAPPAATALTGLAPGTSAAVSLVATTVTEVLLLLVGIGSLLLLVRRRGRVPTEVVTLSLVFLAFVAYVRVSGSAAAFYNIDRAQFQVTILLGLGLALVLDDLTRLLRALVPIAACSMAVVLFATSTGESAVLTGGSPVSLTNGGAGYDQAVMSDEEEAGAAWLISSGGPRPLIFTDEYGILRIWDGTGYAALPQTLLTPATVDQGAWVYVTRYNLAGQAYGGIGAQVNYRYPARFLATVKDRVYSNPESQVYR